MQAFIGQDAYKRASPEDRLKLFEQGTFDFVPEVNRRGPMWELDMYVEYPILWRAVQASIMCKIHQFLLEHAAACVSCCAQHRARHSHTLGLQAAPYARRIARQRGSCAALSGAALSQAQSMLCTT